jgi:hypothetical protein
LTAAGKNGDGTHDEGRTDGGTARDMIQGDDLPGRDDAAPPGDEHVRTVGVRVGDEPPARRWLRPSRRAILVALGAIVLVGVAIAAFVLVRGPGGKHADGAGILASSGSPDFHNSFGRAARLTGPVTGGIRLCLQSGTAPAVIEKVEPDQVVGAGWHYLGASVRVFTPSEGHSTIISIDGYPPPLPDVLQSAVGFGVTTTCGPVGTGPYTELLIGLEPVGTAGGGWDGIDVTYRVGGAEYVLVVRQALVQCGTDPLPAYCQ